MSERELVRWFEEFRSRGDLAALERDFDRTAPELLRLASHLAPDLAARADAALHAGVKPIGAGARHDVGPY